MSGERVPNGALKRSADVHRLPFGLGITLPPSIFPIRASLLGWRRRKVGYAVGHKRFTFTSLPKRGVGPYGLLRTVIFALMPLKPELRLS